MKFFELLLSETSSEGDDPFEKEHLPDTSDEHKLAIADHNYYLWLIRHRLAVRRFRAATDEKKQAKFMRDTDDARDMMLRVEEERKSLFKQIVKTHIGRKDLHLTVAKQHGAIMSSNEVPQKLPKMRGEKPTLDNPYFTSDMDRYAGDPNYFTFTPEYQRQYIEFKRALASVGVPGFTVIYAGYLDTSRKSGGQKRALNFIAYAAEGKICWRKYDVGGGSGQHKIYVKGKETWLSFHDLTVLYSQIRQLLPEYFE